MLEGQKRPRCDCGMLRRGENGADDGGEVGLLGQGKRLGFLRALGSRCWVLNGAAVCKLPRLGRARVGMGQVRGRVGAGEKCACWSRGLSHVDVQLRDGGGGLEW